MDNVECMNLIVYNIFIVFFFIELILNLLEGIIVGLLDEENFFEWEVYIMYV